MTREEEIKEAAINRYGNNGNESQYMLAKIQAFIVGARWADGNPNGNLINWQTGEPKESGMYLVSLVTGFVDYSEAYSYRNSIGEIRRMWTKYEDEDIMGWCPMKNIKPYKEEQQ